MAKQTFTTGQVLTAAQMTSLQQTAMLGGAASAKTASYTLVAADAGTAISMSSASATTITVNTALFAAGDTVQITNLGVGVCTITAGTATVNTASSLALAQYESGTLDFTSTSAAVFYKAAGAAAGGGGKVLQVVQGTTTTATSATTTTFVDTTLTASITPSSATSKVLVMLYQPFFISRLASGFEQGSNIKLIRASTDIVSLTSEPFRFLAYKLSDTSAIAFEFSALQSIVYLDSPSTTSSTTYKTQFNSTQAGITATVQKSSMPASIILLEIGA